MKAELKVKNFKNKEGVNLLKEMLLKTGGIICNTQRWKWGSSMVRMTYNDKYDEFYIEEAESVDYESYENAEGRVQNTATPNGFSFDWKVAIWDTETKEYSYKIIHSIVWTKAKEGQKRIDCCQILPYEASSFEKRFGFSAVKLREDDAVPDVTPWQQKFIDSSEMIVRYTNRYSHIDRTYFIKPSKYMLIMYPQLETMHKIGFKAATDFLYIDEKISFRKKYRYDTIGKDVYSYTTVDAERWGNCQSVKISDLNTIFRPGNNPKEILGIQDKRFVELLKNVLDHGKLVSYLTLIRNGESYDNMVGIIDMDMNVNDLQTFAWVMGQSFNGEKVFSTSQKLINYLRRIDMNEAIDAHSGLGILRDYLEMAIPLGIDPRIDSDSLKREHDVTARIYRIHRDSIMNGCISQRYEELKKHTMKDQNFIIRPIKSQQDLIDEATMQHNCVASYAQRIANGSTEIYVMRTVENPTQSLITIEFCHGEVTQKYYSHNRRVDNAAHLAFIEKWAQKRIENMYSYSY